MILVEEAEPCWVVEFPGEEGGELEVGAGAGMVACARVVEVEAPVRVHGSG